MYGLSKYKYDFIGSCYKFNYEDSNRYEFDFLNKDLHQLHLYSLANNKFDFVGSRCNEFDY